MEEMSFASDDQMELLSAPSACAETKLSAISLFTGAGGLDLGITQASKGEVEFHAWVENDVCIKDTIAANHRDTNGRIFGDINDTNPFALLERAGGKKGDVFLVVGGPPCQAFSTAGLRRSIHDARGQSVAKYFDIIRALKPRFFVFENVRGLLSVAVKHRKYTDRMEYEKFDPNGVSLEEDEKIGSVFRSIILPEFQRVGYEIVYGLVNAADYGTAQIRHRVILVGSRDREFGSGRFRKMTGQQMGIQDLLPPTHHSIAPYPPISPWRTLQDAIGHLCDVPLAKEDAYTYSAERRKVWKRMPPGHYWTYIRDNPKLFPEGLETLLGGAYRSGGGKVGYWRRLSWDRPAPTLQTQPQHLSTGLCHPVYERPLSIPEYTALQDFPSDYIFCGNKSKRYEQIGNAVPVRLGYAIGRLLMAVARMTDGAG